MSVDHRARSHRAAGSPMMSGSLSSMAMATGKDPCRREPRGRTRGGGTGITWAAHAPKGIVAMQMAGATSCVGCIGTRLGPFPRIRHPACWGVRYPGRLRPCAGGSNPRGSSQRTSSSILARP